MAPSSRPSPARSRGGKKEESPAIERAKRVLEIEADAVRGLLGRIGRDFERAVELLAATRGKVIVTGLGKSGHVARKIAATLSSTGTPAFFLHAAEGMHGDLGTVVKGDAALIVSNTGETREIVAVLPVFKRLGLPVVALTGEPRSTLGKAADVVIDVSVREEACPLDLAPTASTTAALAMGDALAIVLMERRGFRTEDFAVIHPAGSIGRKLMRIGELMHRGADVPLVGEEAQLREAIGEMTAKRLGHTGVVDAAGRLIGVVTDGDLRRILERGQRSGAVLEVIVRDLLKRDPATLREHALPTDRTVITIGEEAIGAEAIAVMERYAITALFVVDSERRPIGIIHLHDLLRAGVV